MNEIKNHELSSLNIESELLKSLNKCISKSIDEQIISDILYRQSIVPLLAKNGIGIGIILEIGDFLRVIKYPCDHERCCISYNNIDDIKQYIIDNIDDIKQYIIDNLDEIKTLITLHLL